MNLILNTRVIYMSICSTLLSLKDSFWFRFQEGVVLPQRLPVVGEYRCQGGVERLAMIPRDEKNPAVAVTSCRRGTRGPMHMDWVLELQVAGLQWSTRPIDLFLRAIDLQQVVQSHRYPLGSAAVPLRFHLGLSHCVPSFPQLPECL